MRLILGCMWRRGIRPAGRGFRSSARLGKEQVGRIYFEKYKSKLPFQDRTVKMVVESLDWRTEGEPLIMESSEPVQDVVKAMSDTACGCVFVSQDGRLTGIFSERDFVRKVMGLTEDERKKVMKAGVGNVMKTDVICVYPNTPTLEALEIMMNKERRRYLPVKDPQTQEVTDVISLGDIMKSLMIESSDGLDFMTEYIQGSYSKSYSSSGAAEIPAFSKTKRASPCIMSTSAGVGWTFPVCPPVVEEEKAAKTTKLEKPFPL